jgi:uncharacterized protein YndB with AHSA1/START domain
LVDKSSGVNSFTILSDREVEMTRLFDAPRALVFEAYTNPIHVPHWWGPRGVTTVVEAMDVRPGGAWRFTQHHPDGNQYTFYGEYHEVVPPERLVSTFEYVGMPGMVMTDTLTLTERDGRTLLRVVSRFSSLEHRDAMIESGLEGGGVEMWDRLAEYLATWNLQ